MRIKICAAWIAGLGWVVGCQKAHDTKSPTVVASRPVNTVAGPDAIVLRLPRAGGPPRAYAFLDLDSAMWTGPDDVPPIGRMLGFDDESGTVALIDAKGNPRRLSLRTGEISPPLATKLSALESSDGTTFYGVNATGTVTRLTATDAAPWTFRGWTAARDVAPQPDGSVFITGVATGMTPIWHLHPPAMRVLDSTTLPFVGHLVHVSGNDRMYFVHDTVIVPVRTRTLEVLPALTFANRVRDAVPSPSGDRLYVAQDSSPDITIIDRYSGRHITVTLPGHPANLRMDALGRYVLARAYSGDSAWVIAVGTDRVIGKVQTNWTSDLPFVAPDGTIAVADQTDVTFLDGTTLRPRRTMPGGAHDYWISLRWSGFHQRQSTLTGPPAYAAAIANDTIDSIGALVRRVQDSTAAVSRVDTTPTVSTGYIVQFAAVLNADTARMTASRISANGAAPRVVPTTRGSVTVYRVVLGPYLSRPQADAIGRSTQHPYWVYEGTL